MPNSAITGSPLGSTNNTLTSTPSNSHLSVSSSNLNGTSPLNGDIAVGHNGVGIQKDLYGVGFSPLSIKNKKYAEDEEMMANKDAGMFAIYHKDGSVVSAHHLHRCKNHLQNFITRCLEDGTVGRIYKIMPDDNLVQAVKYSNRNLFTNKIAIGCESDPIDFLRLDFDVDLFSKTDNTVFDTSEILVNFIFTLKKGSKIKRYNISEPLRTINTKNFNIRYTDFDRAEEIEDYIRKEAKKEVQTDVNNNPASVTQPSQPTNPRTDEHMPDGDNVSVSKDDTRGFVTGDAEGRDPSVYSKEAVDNKKKEIHDIVEPVIQDEYAIILDTLSFTLPTWFTTDKYGLIVHDILFALR